MGKKLLFEDVKQYIESQNHVLLDTVYINDHTKMNLKCHLGHTYTIIWNSFKNGRRCPVCKGLEATIRQRTPYEVLVEKVIKTGKKIITTKEEYESDFSKNNKSIVIECVCGKPHIVLLHNLHKNADCMECGAKKTGDRCRASLSDIKEYVESKGYILLSTNYKNNSTKLELLCDKGHNFTSRFADIKAKDSGCNVCKGDKASENSRIPYEDFVSKANEKNIEVLTTIEEYNKNFKSEPKNFLVKCKVCQHEFHTIPTRIGYGFGCEICGYKRSADKRRMPYEEVTSRVEKMGYKLITKDYVNSTQKLAIECPVHGIFNANIGDISKEHKCRKCACIHSKAQIEIFEFVKSFYTEAIEDNRQIIKPFELDIYIPDIKLAIEYCGLYYHNENSPNPRDRLYHITKMKMCNEQGIRLITIFEDEWLTRKDQVKNFLLSAMNKNSIKIMGRKTELKQVPKQEAKDFLKNTHIQGAPLFEVAFGLYYNNELQAVITGNKHHRQNHGHIFVLNRLTFKENVSIAGGSSKLLKALLDYAKQKGYVQLLSWSDNRWSEGRVYEKLGFILKESLGPDYSYVDGDFRQSKQSCKKKCLIRKGAVGGMELTERELALTLNLHRIWDCGKKAWVIDLLKNN